MATRKTEDQDDQVGKSQANLQKAVDSQAKADPRTAADKAKQPTAQQAAKQAEQQEQAQTESIEARRLMDERSRAIGATPSANPEDNQPEPEDNPTNSKPVNVPDDELGGGEEQEALDKQAREALVTDPPTGVLPPNQRGRDEQ
jgi:hypothetical protein